MKIVVLTGSPHRDGNSACLAKQFIKGTREASHEIFRFDSARQKVEVCTVCYSCRMDSDCVLKDDFEIMRPHIIAADMIVFITPMYYFDFSAQMKKVIDRFYAINGQIKGKHKKIAFMMTYTNTVAEKALPMLMHYRALTQYLAGRTSEQWLRQACRQPGLSEVPVMAKEAYQLGKSL